MNVTVESEQVQLEEAMNVLMEHMPPSTVARLMAACQVDKADCLAIREKLFEGETVKSLFEKVRNPATP